MKSNAKSGIAPKLGERMPALSAIAKYEAAHFPDEPLNSLNRPNRDQALVKICKKIIAKMNA